LGVGFNSREDFRLFSFILPALGCHGMR
jgi:hypothetical protein